MDKRGSIFFPKTLHTNPSTLEIMAFFFLFFLPFFFLVFFWVYGDARSAASIIINAHTMRSVQLKTFNKNFNYEGHYFFILNKGLNSGKPLKNACANCFICLADSEEQKEQLYWICFALMVFKSLSLLPKGSVIPFISIDELNQCLSKSLLKSNQNKARISTSNSTS
jgi:cytochrome bd-type quinol oxidase subunit 2